GVAVYDSELGLLADELYSQIDLHKNYGGVVPELASRDHLTKLLPMIDDVMSKAETDKHSLDAICYTSGPGLVGALMVGAMMANTLGYAWGVPALGVHHMEGHLLSPFLDDDHAIEFPMLALLVSGGHTQLVHVPQWGQYHVVGDTLDDAAGEAFDKVAKMLHLSYPGGPAVSKLAEQGDAQRFEFPRPMINRPGLDFSFSGLKTHTLTLINRLKKERGELTLQDKADVAAGFEWAVADTLMLKCRRAIRETGVTSLLMAGGVSANHVLRTHIQTMLDKESGQLFEAPLKYCTDNGAMIAYAGCQRLLHGASPGLELNLKPRWPLDELTVSYADTK
ncbi:MAG: tRNA (adenosine(37)-N6)-threonylcarbamoyltransferase complex transferase subunit TsaD, partial [Pseudomonadota bacterium]